MRIDRPDPRPRKDGEYYTHVGKGYGDPTGEIWLDDKGDLRLQYIHLDDCDRLIKAAAAVKEQLTRQRAEMSAPHGRRHFYHGECQLCGKPEDDELHAEPAAPPEQRETGLVGTIVVDAHDDSPCPPTGKIVGQVDEETVEVLWGERQREDNPGTGTYEPIDALRPAASVTR